MGSMLFCDNKAEALRFEAKAKERATKLLQEMPVYFTMPKGALGIVVVKRLHQYGWSVEADLTWYGEVIRHYESFELLELDLLHMQMGVLRQHLQL